MRVSILADAGGELSAYLGKAAPSPRSGEGWGKNGPGDHYKGRSPVDSPPVSLQGQYPPAVPLHRMEIPDLFNLTLFSQHINEVVLRPHRVAACMQQH